MPQGEIETAATGGIAASLRRSDLFRSADSAVADEMHAAMIERHWRAQEELFAAGDVSDGFYVVIDGAIRLGLATPSGGELMLRDAAAGDMFGEIGALDGGPRSASARVASPTARTAFMPRARLVTILERHPALLLDITRKICQRLRETTEQLEGIALYPLRQRLARFIQAQGKARGHLRNGKMSVSISLSQTALATVLGASRPKINGAMNELERAGAIERKGALILYAENALAHEAEGKPGGRIDAQA
jgi:CRP/FNR family transcriptional regulator, cyclic AMP receptor protein